MVEKVQKEGLHLLANDLKVFKAGELRKNIRKMYNATFVAKASPSKMLCLRLSSKRESMCVTTELVTRISEVTTINDLRITFIEHLSFERHINKKAKRQNYVASIIQRSFMHFDKVIIQSVFVSALKPLVEYGASAWNPLQKNI